MWSVVLTEPANCHECPPTQTLSGFHRRAITALSFSRDGRHLASLGCDDDHSLAVYDWGNSLIRVCMLCTYVRMCDMYIRGRVGAGFFFSSYMYVFPPLLSAPVAQVEASVRSLLSFNIHTA